jgi:hypothetical protein
MNQLLRVLTALEEDLGSVPKTQMLTLNIMYVSGLSASSDILVVSIQQNTSTN